MALTYGIVWADFGSEKTESETAEHALGIFRNRASSGTADAFVQIKTASTDGDAFINLGYFPSEGSSK